MAKPKRCPQCGEQTVYVTCTYPAQDEQLVRRRHCKSCDHKWYTLQAPEQPLSPYRIEWTHGTRNVRLLDEA
jgi:transcriptional regulator NrdR family protein